MKKSELKAFIKEEIKSTLNESVRDRLNDLAMNIGREEFAMSILEIPNEEVLEMIAREFAKMYAPKGPMGEDAQTQQDIKDTEELTKAMADLAKAKEEAGLAEEEDVTLNKSRYATSKYKQANTYKKSYDSLGQVAAEKQFDDDAIDKKASKLAKKETSLAKAKEELAQLTKQMKSLARDYKEAEGDEKEKIVADLKKKTKLKKELEAIIDK